MASLRFLPRRFLPQGFLPFRLLPLWAAFSFLSLVPGTLFSNSVMAASLGWYPFVGMVLGLGFTLPLYLGLGNHALIQACLYVFFQLIFTRALHWDALADCFDAWGSGQRGAKFQTILKDSRIGAFGVLAIAFNLLFQVVAISLVLPPANVPWSVLPVEPALPLLGSPFCLLLLAPFAGRVSILVLFELAPVHSASSLGAVLGLGRSRPQAILWAAILAGLALMVFGVVHAMAFIALLAALLTFLARLAQREGGLNGDFLGCACVLTESIWFVTALLF